MAYDIASGVVVMFGGGCSNSGAQFGDTWTWDGTTWTQRASSGPSHRIAPSMVYDSGRGRVVLFGGYDGATFYNDTWEWDGQTATWARRSTSGPSVRDSAAMTFDSARGRTVLFSGNNSPGDTWEWDGNSWSLRSSSGPSARFGSAMAYDAIRHRSVLFGGTSGLADTWEWDGSIWSQIFPALAPSPRVTMGMVFDTHRQRILLSGGSWESGAFSDAWEWDGAAWAQLVGQGPARHAHAVAYDSTRRRLVLFGGAGSGTNCGGETWEMRAVSPPSITQQPSSLVLDVGQPVILTVVASAPDPIVYQWYRSGIKLLNGGRISGAKTATLTINSAEPADSGEYTVGVSAGGCPVTSSAATILVFCPADYNRDGFVDGIDYDQFNNDFESWDPAQQIHADFNGDGFVDGMDYDQFMNAFESGC